MIGKGLDGDGFEPDKADVAEGPGEAAGVIELLVIGARIHGCGAIEQNTDRDAWLDLKHFKEELFEAHVGAPVDGAEVVAMVEVAVVEELLAGP